MEIIGLSGFARTGKDEVAKILVEEHGFTRIAFADKLREVLYALNPIVSERDRDIAGRYEKYIKVQDVIDQYGWNGYKETPYGAEIRRLLQRLGTEAGRQSLWDSIWIDAAFAGASDDAKIVVADARFYNEFDAVRDRGGKVWRVERPGVGPLNEHASENEATDYPHFAVYVQNDGNLEDLRNQVSRLYRVHGNFTPIVGGSK